MLSQPEVEPILKWVTGRSPKPLCERFRVAMQQVQYGEKRRALCILDPYNIDLDWKTVVQAGPLGTVEIFLNFVAMGINRNAL